MEACNVKTTLLTRSHCNVYVNQDIITHSLHSSHVIITVDKIQKIETGRTLRRRLIHVEKTIYHLGIIDTY